ncbi:unnamed protein product [Phytophthora fragariaefolia]|uniref:Unnamed protein product n=1 Tax=Phytophthora fragariaefolia TaxID=1490495 RepID=A0A9W6XTP2_9STRA|nr:unnamed protein product [Phytophthora fragariaefolia]
MEDWTPNHTIAERIEFLVALERNKWSQEEASERFGIPRATLLGYIAAKDDLSSTESDSWSRCVARPGLPPPTDSSEALIVALVKQRDSAGILLCRGEIIDESASVIRGLKGKSTSAQNSWLTRFIARHKLASHIRRYPNKSKGKVYLKNPTSTCRVYPKKQEDGSEAFPVVILDGGACVTKSSHMQAVSPLVCETMAPCFRPDQEVYNLQVTERDLESIEPNEWLNDSVLLYFIREFIDAHSSTYNFDGQLFGSIFMAYNTKKRNMAKTHEAVRGITATFPCAKYTAILIPVCMDAHWSLIMQNPVLAIDGLTPDMLHVDSLQYHDTGRIERALCGYFRTEALQKYNIKKITYKVNCHNTNPRRAHSYDCGIFMLYFMREVNKAIVRTTGKLILPLSIANICSVPKTDRAHFKSGTLRMGYVKLFRNVQALQIENK